MTINNVLKEKETIIYVSAIYAIFRTAASRFGCVTKRKKNDEIL